MPLFDAYLAVDWSASSVPKTGRDSVWLCVHGSPPENLRTRTEAIARIRTTIRALVRRGKRTLVGFDFPSGYPSGFAELAAPGPGPAWRRVWDLLASRIEDGPGNRNNRFEVAAELNERLGARGPFWGCPAGSERAALTQKRPRPFAFEELRATDRVLRPRVQSPWKLGGAGSVGSQSLVGIPHVASLRNDPALAAVSCLWPFETGFAVPAAEVVHAEIWPGLVEPDGDAAVRDAGQVAAVVREWARLDAGDALAARFVPEAPPGAAREEGWILGAGSAS